MRRHQIACWTLVGLLTVLAVGLTMFGGLTNILAVRVTTDVVLDAVSNRVHPLLDAGAINRDAAWSVIGAPIEDQNFAFHLSWYLSEGAMESQRSHLRGASLIMLSAAAVTFVCAAVALYAAVTGRKRAEPSA